MKYLRALFLMLILLSSLEAAEAPKCQVYFSPEDHLADQLVTLIDKEQKSIYVAVYCFTHRAIIQSLINAKQRGVNVEVIVDPFTVRAGSSLTKLQKAHIPVFVWNPPQKGKSKRQPLMHDKFCVFGSHAVWTGSFNFTYDANSSHQENAIVIENQEIARRFQHQFHAMKHRGCKPYAEIVEPKS